MRTLPTPLPTAPNRHHELVRLSFVVDEPDPEIVVLRSGGGVLGDERGYAGRDDALRAARELTLGGVGAAAIVRSGERFLAVPVISWNQPFSFERGENPFSTADDAEWTDPTVVAFVDGDRSQLAPAATR